eukprot:1160804-Pelagomonas_calceolata.AAC.20
MGCCPAVRHECHPASHQKMRLELLLCALMLFYLWLICSHGKYFWSWFDGLHRKSILTEEPKLHGSSWEEVSDGAKDFVRKLLIK